MLDAYSALGMPLMYHHWSFGKLFAREEGLYRAGHIGLAYEMVINSNPCISYLLEENSMTMQTIVIAHAAFGHNHFFKNNYLFQQWTNAESILEYLAFAKRYIAACEERYGHGDVEAVLDSAHALMDQGVFRYRRPPRPSRARVLEKQRRARGARRGRLQRAVAHAAGRRRAAAAQARLGYRRGRISATRPSCRRKTSSISSRRTRRR